MPRCQLGAGRRLCHPELNVKTRSLTSMIVFGGGARLVGPGVAYFGLGQFHFGPVQLFAPVEFCLQHGLPCEAVAATLASNDTRK